MIVNNVEEDHQTLVMRGIDQRLQILGGPVTCVRRVRQHTVIAPVSLAGKIIDRHQFDRGDTEFGKARQFADNAFETAKRAGMQFVDHRFRPWAAPPRRISPCVSVGIDHNAGIMDVASLRS